MLKFAQIGFGGLGKVHYNNIEKINRRVGDIKLVALCDVDETQFTRQTETNLGKNDVSLDFSGINLYTDYKEMIEKEELDFVITALPTYLHAEVAIYAMDKGIHVFSEKPMALKIEDCAAMIEASKRNNVKLMIGQCLRFCPYWRKVKDYIDSGEYGKVIKAEFQRVSAPPKDKWEDWMDDTAKSGGCILDMHVHDTDFINWLFGKPKAVASVATHYATGYDGVNTTYYYDDKVVVANGDWGYADCFKFSGAYRIRFEKATVTLWGGPVVVYPDGGEPFEPALAEGTLYENEIVDFVNCIREDRVSEINPPESSMQTIEIVLKERESADKNEIVKL